MCVTPSAYAHGHGSSTAEREADNVLAFGKARARHRFRRRQGGLELERRHHAHLPRHGARHAGLHGAGAGGRRSQRGPPVPTCTPSDALGYELLAGRLPFSGLSPRACSAAQVTATPDPVTSSIAPVCPPALAALIMRCLAKHPADRPQSAEELVGQLEAMATPTGGITPQQAEISSGTAAAIRRAHPVRVATLFGFAALGVLTLAYLLVHVLGLPNWAFAGAVASPPRACPSCCGRE